MYYEIDNGKIDAMMRDTFCPLFNSTMFKIGDILFLIGIKPDVTANSNLAKTTYLKDSGTPIGSFTTSGDLG